MNTTTHVIAKDPGDVFGYTAAFDEALKKIGQISPQEFAQKYASSAKYLPRISYDPTTAKFWDEFQKKKGFELNPQELAVFKQNGFVVSERLSSSSFASLFYRIYSNDLPVFLTADSLLHAWHMSYSAMLEELEQSYLCDSLREILEGMARQLPEAWNHYGSNVLGWSLSDADYFLAVVRSLLRRDDEPSAENCHNWICPDISGFWEDSSWGEDVIKIINRQGKRIAFFEPEEHLALRHFTGQFTVEQVQDICKHEMGDVISPNFIYELLKRLDTCDILTVPIKPIKTYFNQDARIAATLKAIKEQQLQEFNLFGRDRQIDFSQFKPRGYYENSKQLKQYFQAMMWCGSIDLRIAGTPEGSSTRELGAAIVLYDLLKRSGLFEQWQQFDQLLQTFVGRTDSMTFAQLGDILDRAKIQSPAEIKDVATLLKLQSDILTSPLGVQGICSHYYESPSSQEKVKLPRAFTVVGQKFVLDTWVMSKVLFDQIVWDEEKVPRLVPTSLDVAFAALGNNQVVPDLVARMTDTTGHEFRDGLNYQHNLAAVRDVVDEQNSAVWEENLYMAWLATLRELSAPTTDPKYPEAMRNRAWAMKTLNTQLASWTQLRHDTILYAEQVYTFSAGCYYPAGFVEPRVSFWERFEKMVMLAANQIEKTPVPNRSVEIEDERGRKHSVQLQQIQRKQTEFCLNFAQKLSVLKGIAVKELAREEFTQEETLFLEDIVQLERTSVYVRYDGWYPKLFYRGESDCDKWDALVTDVHTAVPDPVLGNSGSVLHQGIGNVELLMIAVENGEDKMVYAGPVFSHYEFEMLGVLRKSDYEWRKDITASKWQTDITRDTLPPRPDWTKSYLVLK
jgi:hypothetical protein